MREVIQDIKKPKRSLREVLPRSPVPTIKRVSQSVSDEVEPEPEFTSPPPRPRTGRRGGKFFGFVIVIILLAVLAIGASAFLNQATVKLSPKETNVSLNEETTITAIKKPENDTDLTFAIMTLEMSEGRLLPAKGKEQVSQKASGTITIYNDYSTKSQSLVKDTRFEAKNGKIYRISQAVTVPGQKKQGAETVPGSVEATIQADEPGADYNSDLTEFTIPGFRGDPRYTKFSAKSKTTLSGGLVGEVSLVEPADKARVKAELEDLLTKRLLEEAKTKVPADFIFYNESPIITFTEINPQPGSVSAAGEVEFKEGGKLTVPIFHRQKLSQHVAKSKLGESVGEEKVIINNLEQLTFKVKGQTPTTWEQVEELEFTLNGEAKISWLIDQEELKNSLTGLSKDGYQSVFSQYPAIKRAEVIFRPPWIREFPTTVDKIKIEIDRS